MCRFTQLWSKYADGQSSGTGSPVYQRHTTDVSRPPAHPHPLLPLEVVRDAALEYRLHDLHVLRGNVTDGKARPYYIALPLGLGVVEELRVVCTGIRTFVHPDVCSPVELPPREFVHHTIDTQDICSPGYSFPRVRR